MAQTAQINIKIDGKQAEQSVNTLNQSLQQTEQSTSSLRAQLRQVTQELQGLEPGSARFSELSQRAGQLRDTIQDTNAVINATAGNATENLAKGLTNVASIGVNAFQGIMGAATLFGVESEDLQKTMVALQGAMALTSSLEFFGGLEDKVTEIKASFQGLGQALGLITPVQQASTVATTAQGVATTSTAVATNTATVATKALSVAMYAIPIMAIVGGLILLIANWEKLTGATNSAARAGKLQADVSKKVVEATSQEVSAADRLKNKLNDETLSREQKIAAVKKFQAQYPGLLSNMNTEKNSLGEINNALTLNIQLRRLQAKAQAIEELRGEKVKETLNNELEYQEKVRGGYQLGARLLGVTDNVDKKRIETLNEKNKAANEDIKFLDKQLDATEKEIDVIVKKGAVGKEQQDAENKRLKDAEDAADKAARAGEERQRKAQEAADKARQAAEEAERKRQELRQTELDYFEKAEDRRKKYEQSNQKLIIESGLKEVEGQEGVFTQMTEMEKDFALKRIELENEKSDIINVAVERNLSTLKEEYVKGTMTLQEFENKKKTIVQNGANNLLEAEKEYLILRGEQQDTYETEQLEKSNERKIANINKTNIIEEQINISRTEMEKERAIFSVQQSNLTEKEKQKQILEIQKETNDKLKYYIEQEQIDKEKALTDELNIILKNDKLSFEEKELAKKEYDANILALDKTTQTKLQGLTKETTVVEKEEYVKRAEAITEFLNVYGAAVTGLLGNLNELSKQTTENRISGIQQEASVEQATLQQQFDSRLISEEEYNAQKLQIESKTDEEIKKLKRKQFQRDKALNIANAIMSGAQAVLQALASSPPPANFILAAIAGVASGVQIATISQQQFTAARGGIVPGNGLPGDVDSVSARLAPGEAVINSRSTAMFGNTLSMINQAGGGIPLSPQTIQQGSSGSGGIFGENQPQQIRAYVVETEITDTQRRVGRIERSVEF
jgi:hypothetical protein